jgi:hypothetical protein
MMRRSIVIFSGVTTLAVLLSACGGAPRSTGLRISTDNNCGAAYVLKSANTQAGTTCGGMVGYPPLHVTLRRGERFEVSAAANIGTTHYPALQARGNAIKDTSKHDASVEYIAVRVGRATLVAKSRYCQKPIDGDCVAFVLFIS